MTRSRAVPRRFAKPLSWMCRGDSLEGAQIIKAIKGPDELPAQHKEAYCIGVPFFGTRSCGVALGGVMPSASNTTFDSFE